PWASRWATASATGSTSGTTGGTRSTSRPSRTRCPGASSPRSRSRSGKVRPSTPARTSRQGKTDSIAQEPGDRSMRMYCDFSTPVARTGVDDYVRHLVISIECYDEHCAESYFVGKLAMDQILWSDALADGVSLFDICDNDSQGLHEAHVILTN